MDGINTEMYAHIGDVEPLAVNFGKETAVGETFNGLLCRGTTGKSIRVNAKEQQNYVTDEVSDLIRIGETNLILHDTIPTDELETASADAIERAGLADIYVHSFVCETEPLMTGVYGTFKFRMDNIGGTQASLVDIAIYIDGVFADEFVMGSVPANTQATATLEFTLYDPGNHTIKIEANRSRCILETNYNNNSTSKQFTWLGNAANQYVDLCVYSIETLTGSNTVPLNQDIPFQFIIVNYGNKTVRNVPCYLEIDGTPVGAFNLVEIGGNSYLPGDFAISFGTYGMRKVGIVCDPNNTTGDVDMSDNYLFKNIYVSSASGTHDDLCEVYPWRWAFTPNSIKVSCNSSVISPAQAVSAGQKWNGITNNIYVMPNAYLENGAEDIRVIDYAVQSDALAKAGPREGYYNGSTATKGEISCNIANLGGASGLLYTSNDKIGIIAHEFGHLWSLKHAFCGERSIMSVKYQGVKEPTVHDQGWVRQAY